MTTTLIHPTTSPSSAPPAGRSAAITIPAHLNGPPRSGHGGVFAGRAAAFIDPRRARVRLRAPVPLETPLVPIDTDDGVVVTADGIPTGIGLVTALDGGLPDPDLDAFRPLGRSVESSPFDGRGHPCPTCLTCGTHRPDGFRLRMIGADGRYRCSWHPGLVGHVPYWLVWAALDCPTGGPAIAAVGDDEFALTGELAVDIRRHVPGDRMLEMLSRLVDRDGRKIRTEAVLLDGDEVLAVASALWIVVGLDVLAGAS